VTNDIASNQRHQRRAENVDTVGVTGSIPVSPTLEGPGFRGLRHFRNVVVVPRCQRNVNRTRRHVAVQLNIA
jgi:hypothetical protein